MAFCVAGPWSRRCTVKRAPPSGRELACTLPPCRAAKFRTSVSPRPVPGCGSLARQGPCTNGSKIAVCRSSGMPSPSSSTMNSTPSSRRRVRTVTVPPGGVWRTALATRLITMRSTLAASTSRCSGARSVSRRLPRRSTLARAVRPAGPAVRARGLLRAGRSTSGRRRAGARSAPRGAAFADSRSRSRSTCSAGSCWCSRRRVSASPSTAVSGVRSSCEVARRNASRSLSLAWRRAAASRNSFSVRRRSVISRHGPTSWRGVPSVSRTRVTAVVVQASKPSGWR